MGSTAGDSRRRRIVIPRRPSGTTRAPRIAGLFSIADVGSTQRPRGQRADGSPALRLFRLRSGLNCGKSARYGTNTTGCGWNKAWWQNLRCDGADGCHLRLLRIIRTIHSVFFFHGLRFFRTIRVIIRILARLQGRPSFALLFLFFPAFPAERPAHHSAIRLAMNSNGVGQAPPESHEYQHRVGQSAGCRQPSCQPSSCFFLSTSRFRA